MKRFLGILVAISMILLLFVGCETEKQTYPTATKEFYVNDFADVISQKDEELILANAATLDEKTTAQVVVVTVDDLDGKAAWEYALELGREWGVGDKEKNNGIVILLSKSEREINISVGYGLEGALPDSKTGRIIDLYGMEYLKNNDFSKGLFEISNAVIGEVYLEYGLDVQDGYTSITTIEEEKQEDAGSVIVSWIIMIVIIAVISIVFRGGGGIFFFPFSTHGGNHRGGFGGFGGGGFGGFSGGGGSFGGGGAGRKF